MLRFRARMNPDQATRLTEHLARFVTDHKRALIERVLAHRTRYVTVVVEDLYQPHNAAAVVRTCDCYGVQDVHVIENHNRFQPSEAVSVGAGKWIDLHRHRGAAGDRNTTDSLRTLKTRGYRIVAMTLRQPSLPVSDLPLDQPIALCFGSEEPGLTETAHAEADLFAHLPMVGFTQSFNISVSAALTLHELTGRLRRSDTDWHLTNAEAAALRLAWYRSIVPNADAHARRLGISIDPTTPKQ